MENLKTPEDRRSFPRLPAVHGCRTFRPTFNSFGSGRTRDYSAGGALIDLTATRPVSLGETIDVHIEFKSSAVLPAGEMKRATVVRAGVLSNGTQQVAVRFAQPLAAQAA
jgi:hypothetical protein